MSNILIYIVFTILLPVALLIIFLEKRARRVMLSFMCGISLCLAAYWLNTSIYQNMNISSGRYALVFGPIVEEILKFIPLVLFSLILRKGKRQTIAMSFALGVGFCLVENLFFLINNISTINVSWIFIRSIGTGLMHAMSATFIGFGLYQARTDERKHKIIFGTVTLLIAMAYHALFNILISIDGVKLLGVFIPIISYIVISILLRMDAIKAFFDDDIIKEKSAKEV